MVGCEIGCRHARALPLCEHCRRRGSREQWAERLRQIDATHDGSGLKCVILVGLHHARPSDGHDPLLGPMHPHVRDDRRVAHRHGLKQRPEPDANQRGKIAAGDLRRPLNRAVRLRQLGELSPGHKSRRASLRPSRSVRSRAIRRMPRALRSHRRALRATRLSARVNRRRSARAPRLYGNGSARRRRRPPAVQQPPARGTGTRSLASSRSPRCTLGWPRRDALPVPPVSRRQDLVRRSGTAAPRCAGGDR